MHTRSAAAFRERYGVTARDVSLCACAGIIYAILLSPLVSVGISAASGIFAVAMLCILISDVRRMLVPDVLSIPLMPLGLAVSITALPYSWHNTLLDHGAAAALGAGSLYILRALYSKWRGVIGLGLGDVKLAAVGGAWLGLEALPIALLFAAVAGLVVILGFDHISGEKRLALSSAVPFGAFLAPAFLFMWAGKLVLNST